MQLNEVAMGRLRASEHGAPLAEVFEAMVAASQEDGTSPAIFVIEFGEVGDAYQPGDYVPYLMLALRPLSNE